jgi:hypothetical protein
MFWLIAYSSLRAQRTRLKAWVIASGIALIWPPWFIQYRIWKRSRPSPAFALPEHPTPSPRSVADEAEAYLRQVG